MSDKTIMYIAKALLKARENAGLTQAQLGAKAGVSTNYISRIERADTSPSASILEKLVRALGVKSSDILPF